MPTVAQFYGITIRMFYTDQPPPHFHAFHGDHRATVDIETAQIIIGALPKMGYRVELRDNWRRSEAGEPLERSPGLD